MTEWKGDDEHALKAPVTSLTPMINKKIAAINDVRLLQVVAWQQAKRRLYNERWLLKILWFCSMSYRTHKSRNPRRRRTNQKPWKRRFVRRKLTEPFILWMFAEDPVQRAGAAGSKSCRSLLFGQQTEKEGSGDIIGRGTYRQIVTSVGFEMQNKIRSGPSRRGTRPSPPWPNVM